MSAVRTCSACRKPIRLRDLGSITENFARGIDGMNLGIVVPGVESTYHIHCYPGLPPELQCADFRLVEPKP